MIIHKQITLLHHLPQGTIICGGVSETPTCAESIPIPITVVESHFIRRPLPRLSLWGLLLRASSSLLDEPGTSWSSPTTPEELGLHPSCAQSISSNPKHGFPLASAVLHPPLTRSIFWERFPDLSGQFWEGWKFLF